jgi:DNA-binding NarL/FixJ family response regulator
VIPVLVSATSPVIRAGLRATVEDLPDFEFAGAVNSSSLVAQAAELEPGVVLWQLAPEEEPAGILHALGNMPVLILAQQPSMDLIRSGARGVLPVDATPEQIGIALKAVATELVVVAPEAIHRTQTAPAGSALTARETEVLRMMPRGLQTRKSLIGSAFRNIPSNSTFPRCSANSERPAGRRRSQLACGAVLSCSE